MSIVFEPGLTLQDKVQYLPGVGPRRAEVLGRLGIVTVGDLLEYLPIRHERQEARTIENLDEGMVATVVGQISSVHLRHGGRGPTASATLVDNTGCCHLCWFNAPWIVDRLRRGMVIRATGRVGQYRQRAQMVNPRFEVLDLDAEPVDESAPPRFETVYPATADMPTRAIGRLIASNLDRMLPLVREWFPPAYLKERQLVDRRWALRVMHRPQSGDDVSRARRRLAYDELFLMQLAFGLARHYQRHESTSPALKNNDVIDARIRRRFPFTLTRAQDQAIAAIVADLAQTRPMNRLLQGDVGCGKTVVALYAALVAVANRTQVAIMTPTELLAEQHYRSIALYLSDSRVRYGLLVGKLPARQRREMLGRIERGEMDIVVGTQALIQQDVRFGRLGLVVVDEQHRFGVRQRATIRSKALAPHYLVMTATPIPRTLAMTVFGDLDVTTIEGMPPGRAVTVTRVCGPTARGSPTMNLSQHRGTGVSPWHRRLAGVISQACATDGFEMGSTASIETDCEGAMGHQAAWDFVRSRLEAGEQAYVVYPLVDESDKMGVKAATTEYRRLAEQVFAGLPVGLLHGRMDRAEREAVMRDFVAGRLAVLVATTVVEVGIDVPNATCMVIEHAERYGLSQLHQLRGRIGRGGKRGYCFLMTDNPSAVENERLGVLARTTDGFRIAEEDLRLRGPGEMLGTRQHGLPELRVADLLRDGDLLRMAQRDAARVVRADPQLRQPEHSVLRSMLLAKYRETIGFMNVG